MQRFHFGRRGHFSTSELFDAPLGENEPEHGERVSQRDAEINVFSS